MTTTCRTCHGEGLVPQHGNCYDCKGEGKIIYEDADGDIVYEEKCDCKHGKKFLKLGTCPTCRGSGEIND